MSLDWEGIARATVHPLALDVLQVMAEDPDERWSPVALTDAMGFPRERLPLVAYHVKALHERGLLRRAGSRPRRGAVEHFYLLSARARA